MKEILSLRQENSKTFALDDGKRQWRGSVSAIHYKDNYADKSEEWKDIDLTWEGNRITKAPYELTLDGNKITIKDKKSGEVSTIELIEIGGVAIPVQAWEHSKGLAKATDLEIVADLSSVRFARILKSGSAPLETKFRVTGKIPFRVMARDGERDLPVEWDIKDGILTETLKADRPIKYPVRIDPTWSVAANTDDTTRGYDASYWGLNDSGWWCGYIDATNHDLGAAARFLNVTIPNGAVIDTAVFEFTSLQNRTETVVNTRIRMQDADTTVTFVDTADFDARSWTTAFANWDGIGTYAVDAVATSPDFAPSVKEVVDRPGFSSGSSMVLLWDDWEKRSDQANARYRVGYSYNASAAKSPDLIITYTDPFVPTIMII